MSQRTIQLTHHANAVYRRKWSALDLQKSQQCQCTEIHLCIKSTEKFRNKYVLTRCSLSPKNCQRTGDLVMFTSQSNMKTFSHRLIKGIFVHSTPNKSATMTPQCSLFKVFRNPGWEPGALQFSLPHIAEASICQQAQQPSPASMAATTKKSLEEAVIKCAVGKNSVV